jgi:hypothetical protein
MEHFGESKNNKCNELGTEKKTQGKEKSTVGTEYLSGIIRMVPLSKQH